MIEILPVIITSISAIIVALISVWLKHFLDTQKEDRKRKKEEGLTGQDVDSMMEIQNYLEDVMKEWGFDRAGIFQFHNGGKFFNGVSMKKYSQTYEAIAPGIAGVKKEKQNILVTQHTSLMKHISESDFFYVDSKDPVLDYMRERVESEGVIQIVTVPLRNLAENTVGFVQFYTIKKKARITEEMKTNLIEAAGKITGYLGN
jgi:hypothetical protein